MRFNFFKKVSSLILLHFKILPLGKWISYQWALFKLMKMFYCVLFTVGKSDKIFELLYIRIICHLDRYSRNIKLFWNHLPLTLWYENYICLMLELPFVFLKKKKKRKLGHFSESSLVDLTFGVKDDNLTSRDLMPAHPSPFAQKSLAYVFLEQGSS